MKSIFAAGSLLAFASAVSAQNPLDCSPWPLGGGEPLSGSGALALPGKGASHSPAMRLGERTPLLPPFCEVFDDYPVGSEHDQFERCFQVINSNGDTNPSGSDRSWSFYNYSGESNGRVFSKCAYLLYPLEKPKCDDWLIPRAIKLEAGKYYRITMDASLYAEGAVHCFEVKMGEYNDAEGMTWSVVPPTDVTTTRPMQVEGWFCPEYDGLYYMGIHGISDRALAAQGYLFVDNIAMEAPRTGSEPGRVTDVTFVSDPDGTPSATVSFKAPAECVDGSSLSGQVTVTVKRGDVTVGTYTGAAGQTHTFVDTVDEAGYYSYTFTAENSIGSGCDLRLERFVGMAAPMAPVVTSISEPETGYVRLTWSVPATDVNGTAINPEKLRYNVYDVTEAGYTMREVECEETDVTYNMELRRGEQAMVMLAVAAVLNDVESERSESDFVFVGAPYELPYINSFTEAEDYVSGANGDEGVRWRMLDDFSDPKAQDGDGGYVAMVGTQPGQYGELTTGKLDFTGADNPYVSFYTYAYADDQNEISLIVVDCDTNEQSVLKSYRVSELGVVGWTRIICPLTDYAGKTVRVVLGAKIMTHGVVAFDNMVIDNMDGVDLSVEVVDFTPYATLDEEYTVTARVSNFGSKQADAFETRLWCDGVQVCAVNGVELAPFASVDVKLTGTFSVANSEMPTFKVEVAAKSDVDLSNNQSSPFNITFIAPLYPVVTDLRADEDGSAVTLTWGAPDLTAGAPEELLEDFESYAPFSTELDGFTMADADGGFVAGFNGLDMPMTGTAQAFWTMTSEAPYDFLSTRGNSSLFAMATVDSKQRPIANDDWLISPELYGGRQTISFWARSQTIDYGYETFEVYASSVDDDVANFTKVMYETQAPEQWTQYFVTLPAGTRYFAICCTSNDRMLFALDDITCYVAGDSPLELQLKGYNVYRNGVRLNSEPVTATTYVTERELEGDDYFVTAVYDLGESTSSNVVRVGKSGIDAVVADGDDAEAEYFDLRGVRVNPSALTPGIYVVRRGASASKLLVR